jgi:hypothetical protein
MKHNIEYLFYEKIDNPNDAKKSPWHVAVTSIFPNRVTVTNPNDTLAGRAKIDELLETTEIPLLGRKDEAIKIPADMIERIVEVVEVTIPEQSSLSANPFEK